MPNYEGIQIYGLTVNILNNKTKQLQIFDEKKIVEPHSSLVRKVIQYLNAEAFSYIGAKEEIKLEIFRPN